MSISMVKELRSRMGSFNRSIFTNEKLQISLFHAGDDTEKLYSSQLEIAILDYVRSYYKMKVLAIDTSNYVMGVSLIEEET